MSSHHIIRDKQEPALIIANGEACSLDMVEQLLEWSPTVIVLDGAIERVVSLGIKVDVWLGDFDHVHTADYSNYPLKKVHTPDQNLTDLEIFTRGGLPSCQCRLGVWETDGSYLE